MSIIDVIWRFSNRSYISFMTFGRSLFQKSGGESGMGYPLTSQGKFCENRPMDMFAIIAERRIQEAMARGDFDNLPGRGKPLVLEDLSGVPEELRMAYKVLKNAGCVPPEVELTNEVASLRRLVLGMEEGEDKKSRVRELNFKLMKLEMTRKRPLSLDLLPQYRDKLLDKLQY